MNKATDKRRRMLITGYFLGSIILTFFFAYLAGFGSYVGVVQRNIYIGFVFFSINLFIANHLFKKHVNSDILKL